ncbi:glycosyl transferase family 2 [Candidatus Beckwithbacteria bacterium CG23_combo_of_CG06-09_8_20_14_all_34_8]|uniref:Glycosyl transferase family 2 n=1 Tax=Candidatus Beckwithbacteria bacterium CG23_combo_of_CG06-09_8_20_14_all_34_8 TaxID=1974497 RepID=A0A2H0B5B5_9BACT|nr:MAG: glycosyl transferase family 2 [Candidatus Beckwithbacteria bacterium CG23_combo_of_CG06-09_8_20_14_all_34_8]
MKNTPYLSIIIVNFNTYKLITNCLDSIINQNCSKNIEIIVVDNASSDDSVKLIKESYPLVKIIENNDNLGFGKANNQGVAQARGTWIMLLNSDTIIPKGTINDLITKLKDQKNEIIGIKLLNQNNTIQPSAGYFPSLSKIIMQMLFIDDLPLIKRIIKPYQQNTSSFYNDNHEVDWVTGACILMLKNNYDFVGGFDEKIFMYGEEVDLCYRLKQNGCGVKYWAEPFIYHLKGASSVDGFKAAIIGEFQGLITFYQKHYSQNLKILKIILGLGALLRVIVFGMISPNKVTVYKQALKIIYSKKYEN